MEWWQTLLVAAVAPAVTAVALIWQDRVNSQRDEKRRLEEAAEREQDRRASEARETRTRRQAIHDHWREERKKAHADYLEALEAGASALSHQTMFPSQSDVLESGLGEELSQRVRAALAVVQMLSLPGTRELAETAFVELTKADSEVFFQTFVHGHDADDDTARRIAATEAVRAVNVARGHYLDAVRQELGTDDLDA